MTEIANNNIDIEVVDTQSENAQYFWHNTTDSGAGEGAGAHITEIPREDFVADPDHGGGNTLITSGGMLVRNGKKVSAEFGDDEIVLYTADGVPAFSVNSGSGSSVQLVDSGESVGDDFTSLNQTATGQLPKLIDVGNGDSFIVRVSVGQYSSTGQIIPIFYEPHNETFTKASSGTTTKTGTLVDRTEAYQIGYTITYSAPSTISVTLTSATQTSAKYRVSAELFYYALVNDSQVNIASDDELYYALANLPAPWTSLISGDMLDLRQFIKTLLTHMRGFFEVDTHTFSYPAISSGSGSGTRTATFSKAGYYPLGVMGFRTGNSSAVAVRFNLSSRSIGSAELSYVLRAVGSVSAGSGDVDILWVKAE